MKTKNTKLFAILLIVATVTATTFPSVAQRRSTQRNQEKNTPVERTERSRRNTVREKSTFKKREIQRRTPKESATRAKRSNRSENRSNLKSTSPGKTNNKPAAVNRSGRERYNNSVRRSTSTRANTEDARVRANPENKRKVYRLDKNDNRYRTNKNYKGSKKYWNRRRAPNHVHYRKHTKNYYANYNYYNHNHWDHKWERYRWDLNSWRDYYNSYHPYSYRFHKHYYHHPKFGHVIRTFASRPWFFVHNHNRYYIYNGHFFRFFRGVGYVLVDMPYGIVFEQLPPVKEQVYINGYRYFRVGNLFFELTNHGFRLVHYPERYFAYNDRYYNNGYYCEDDNYYYD